MNKGIFEKEYFIVLLLFFVILGESIFFFGFLGVVKSFIVRCLKLVFD